MIPQFVEIKTGDGLALPGLLYTSSKSKSLAIFLHGNGSTSVFYDGNENRIFADALAKKGISTLFFNNRGAHIIKKLNVQKGKKKDRKAFGMAHEKIRGCIEDIDGAVAFGKKRGFKSFYLIGLSTGANKICVYNYYKPRNQIRKYAIICGSDDTGIYYHQLGKAKFWKLLKLSKQRIVLKKGDELMPELLPNEIFSNTGFRDIANPDGDYNVFPFYEVLQKVKLSKKPLFRHFKSIKKPSLVVYGGKDEYAWGDVSKVVEILKSKQPNFEYKIIKGANHGFVGYEHSLATTIASWLSQLQLRSK
ncbi:MAG: DUF1749 domain-containing protein [Patescibacteria group bacterium]